jgi:hypothetical protein
MYFWCSVYRDFSRKKISYSLQYSVYFALPCSQYSNPPSLQAPCSSVVIRDPRIEALSIELPEKKEKEKGKKKCLSHQHPLNPPYHNII